MNNAQQQQTQVSIARAPIVLGSLAPVSCIEVTDLFISLLHHQEARVKNLPQKGRTVIASELLLYTLARISKVIAASSKEASSLSSPKFSSRL